MKLTKYILLPAAALAMLTACNDDELAKGNPMMNVKTDVSQAHFGDSLRFVINASDAEVPLSTIHAKLYFGSELVSEEVIRTKVSGKDYEGRIYVPYIGNTADGRATLRLSLQNINFTRVETDYEVMVTHADYPYLTFICKDGSEETEYRMERKAKYVYEFTDRLPQKIKGLIYAEPVDDNGNTIVFGYEGNTVKAGAEEGIPFSNSKPGKYTVSFNTFTFEASPFVTLKINGEELTTIDENHAQIDLNLERGATVTPTGFPNFGEWWIDPDFFDQNDDGSLKFLSSTGSYRIIADQNLKYFRVYRLNGGNPATLASDGSGALWIIGDNIGKPSLAANTVGWTTENALCMAEISDRVYQVTLVGGKTVSTGATNFKFFGQMGWGVELKGSANFVAVESDLIGVGDGNGHDDGNLYLLDGKRLVDNTIYKFTVDLTGGLNSARLIVTEHGEQPFEEKKVYVNGQKMSTNDNSLYNISINLSKGDKLSFEGADLSEMWFDPDYFAWDSEADEAEFLPLNGYYRISLNLSQGTMHAIRLNSDGSDATLTGDGHSIWLMGWGVGSPSQDHQFGWTPGVAYCMAEVAPGIYQFTGSAGPENGSEYGNRLRYDYLSFKFFHQNGWGGEYSGASALKLVGTASQFIKDAGNFELAGGVQLERGATYVITVDTNAGTIDMARK